MKFGFHTRQYTSLCPAQQLFLLSPPPLVHARAGTHTTDMRQFEFEEAAKCTFSVITLQLIDMTIIQMSRMDFYVRQFISKLCAIHYEGQL